MLVFFRPWGQLNARHLYTVVLGCDKTESHAWSQIWTLFRSRLRNTLDERKKPKNTTPKLVFHLRGSKNDDLQIMILLKSDGKLNGGCSGRFKKNYSILSNGWITVRNIHGRLTRTAHYKVAVGSRFREDLNERSDYPLGALNVFFAYTKTQGRLSEARFAFIPS